MIQHWTELGSLWNAARRAARGKRHRPSVARVLFDLEGTVLRLRRELRDGTWQPGIPQAHAIREPKPRIIHAAPFADRIVHQALCAAIGPLLDRGLIEHSYACRVGKGTHAAVRQARLWARSYSHFVHLDVVKFFPSLDHAILLAQLERVIPCEATRAICERIVQAWRGPGVRFYFPGDDLFTPYGRSVGLPIGNLTSQHFANRYLSPVDHRAKDRLRIRPYLRYMDDMLFFGNDRSQLQDWAHELEDACYRQRARLHPWQVQVTQGGVGWLGFRILPNELRVKRSSVVRAQKRLRDEFEGPRDPFMRSLRSTFAHWGHGTTWKLRTKTLHNLGILASDPWDPEPST